MTKQMVREAMRQEWAAIAKRTAPDGPTNDTQLNKLATDMLAAISHSGNDHAALCVENAESASKAARNVTVREDEDINTRLGKLMRLSDTKVTE